MTSKPTTRALCGAAAWLLGATLSACGQTVAPPATPAVPTSAPTEAPTPAPTRQAVVVPTVPPIDLMAVVLGPHEAPPGMSHDATVTGPETLTFVIVSGRESMFEALEGFVDGRVNLFSGDAGALLTAALAFENSLTADFASHAYQGELTRPDGYDFRDAVRNTVAMESLCGTGKHPDFPDLTENICVWHTGPITFLVGGPIPMADVLEIAEELAERAMPWTP